MRSKTYIVRYTRNVLEGYCRQKGITPEALRLGTLKRVDCELANLLDPGVAEIHLDHREALEDLHRAVRLAIGDE